MGWIDVKESMPDDDQEVEVFASDGRIRKAYGIHIGKQKGFRVNATKDFYEGHMHYEITHWRTVLGKSHTSQEISC